MSSKKKILLIEDEVVIRRMMSLYLRKERFEVLEAENGTKGLDLARKEQPDLIVTDLMMPGLDGLQVTHRLKTEVTTREIPVIVLSAVSSRENVVKALQAGAVDFLVKASFDMPTFLSRIQKHLGRKERRLEKEKEGVASPTGLPAEKEERKKEEEPQKKPKSARRESKPSKTKPLIGRERLEADIAKIREAKALPFVAAQVLRLTISKETHAKRIVEELYKDQAIAAKVLKMANSAYYVVGSAVTSLERAVVNIGAQGIRELVVGLGVLDQFKKPTKKSELDRIRLWEHSFACASYARRLARQAGYEEPEMLFLSGLLHDLGMAIYDDFFHEEYTQVLKKLSRSHRPLAEWEEALLGYTHADLCVKLLELWGVDRGIVAPVAHYRKSWTEIGQLEKVDRRAVSVLAVSNLLAKARGITVGLDEHLSFVPDAEIQRLKVTPEDILKMHEGVDADIKDLRLVFFTHESEEAESRYRDEAQLGKGRRVLLWRDEEALFDPVETWLRAKGFSLEVREGEGLITAGYWDGVVMEVHQEKTMDLLQREWAGKKGDASRESKEVHRLVLVSESVADAAEKRFQEDTELIVLFEPFPKQEIVQALGCHR
jgi:HD-like signal output (HDOD) protein/DNA-binding response OmpR family regulator